MKEMDTKAKPRSGDTGLAKFMAKARQEQGLPTEEFSVSGKSTGMQVPRTMLMSEALRKNAKSLRDVPLIPLNCTFGVVKEKDPVPFKAVVKKETKMKRSDVSVVFVVRRPGCVSCREHGQQLTELAAEDPNIAFWAIVKETGIEEEGILTFFSDYYHFPIYKDEKWKTYKAMGDRTLTSLKILKRCLAARGRWAEKGLVNRLKGGDIWVQGGVLLFKRGRLRYAYEEQYGKELVIDDIRAAIKVLQVEEDDMTYTCTEASDFSMSFRSIQPSFRSTRTEI